jgi:hypothetical protein
MYRALQNAPSVRNEDNYNNTSTNVPNKTSVPWYFIVEENTIVYERGFRLSGQYEPTSTQQSIGGKIVEAGGYSRDDPLIQWVGGKLKEFTFETRLYSEHSNDNTAEEKLRVLQDLAQRDAYVGRPPLLLFFWGNVLPNGMRCFIESVGSSFDHLRSDGSIRGVTVNITLKKFTRFKLTERNFTPINETVERTPSTFARDGETYEMIAYRIYQDPMYGVLLRRKNPRYPIENDAPSGVADLTAGDKVKLYSRGELKREELRPECHVLRMDNQLAVDNRRRFFYLRSKLISVLPSK